jgi:hypothetical protein
MSGRVSLTSQMIMEATMSILLQGERQKSQDQVIHTNRIIFEIELSSANESVMTSGVPTIF